MAKAGRGSDQFPLRLPDGMRDRIKEAAERNNRSMNAEIVAALEDKFPEVVDYERELRFAEEIMDIQDRLDRIRKAQLALEMKRTEQAISKADELLKKPGTDK